MIQCLASFRQTKIIALLVVIFSLGIYVGILASSHVHHPSAGEATSGQIMNQKVLKAI
jgi:hypothetical protein